MICLEATLNIARTCHELGIKVGVNTNGTLLNAEVARRLKAAGINVVKISFDSLDNAVLRDKMGPGITSKQILEAISVAVETGFEVIMRFTLSRFNRQELIPCYKLGRKLSVHQIQVKPLIQSGRAIGCADLLSTQETTAALQSLAHASSLRNESDILQVLCWPSEKAGGLKSKGCGSLNKLYIDTDFMATICNFIPSKTLGEDWAVNSLESMLANRKVDVSEVCCNQSIVKGCPQLPFFR